LNRIEWTDLMSVGIKQFDDQHKILFSLLNKLYTAIAVNDEYEIQEKRITDLVIYIETHFSEEEKYFAQFNYPLREEHIREHKYFYNKVKGYATDFYSGRVVKNIELWDFLIDWLKAHILKSDNKYKEFFLSKGLK